MRGGFISAISSFGFSGHDVGGAVLHTVADFFVDGPLSDRRSPPIYWPYRRDAPALLPFASLLIMLFAVVASLVSTRGLLLAQPWPLIFRDLMLLGWSVLLTQLDVARGWLPLRFTGGFILGGLLFTLLPYASSSALQALVEGGVIFGVLSLFRCWANRHGLERFGLGDVYLLMGLSVWLTLPVTVSLTLFALGIILLQAGLAWLGLAPQPREIPFALIFAAVLPWLC
ncbi:hypothetical protein CCS41_13815 (plasmid) [Candidatus Fukatsuia symbiotica]|uniref:Prepilin type IV endopeptidase peptidase domain-containing protein n=1 Tax=Candidatus Fukatsuia symbiotica TaxID=1878942 RepID=A0A2U8IAZ1_9GAMM|nr:prepilin peptidase [Candidatus Fukatsuia symbiotica]AWK15504.1 hypothetical protein CCS41_13815 [Candidatus Fukatsuia symbiotica]